MKKLILLLISLLFTFSFVVAYDYQSVYSHRTVFFQEAAEVLPIRIDSIKINGDTTLYPFRNIEMVDYNCFDPKGASWMGKKIVINQNWNYFFNAKNDTIKIKTSASLNESWDVYSSPEILIKGTVISVDTVHFLGLIDSVKTIELKAYTITLNALPHKLDNKKIRISKHYGFIDAVNFNSWPDYQFTYIQGDIFQPTLAGMTHPEIGIENLTWFKVFDFQPGDEIHVEYSVGWPFGSPPPYFTTNKKTIKKYISRTDYTDSIQYTFEVENVTTEYIQGNYTSSIYKGLSTETIRPNAKFDKLARETIFDDYSAGHYTQSNSTWQKKNEPYIIETLTGQNDSNCWTNIIADGCFPFVSYYKGLGGPYSFCEGWMFSFENNSLVYYKKGAETWGTPLVIDGLSEAKSKQSIAVYPNPATDIINFGVSDNAEIAIADLQGKLLINKAIGRFDNSISLKNLSSGMYIYRIVQNGNIIQTGKISKL